MINRILENIDNEECYYVGNNGCLYQNLDKKELLVIKEEIERLNKENKLLKSNPNFVYAMRNHKAIEYIETRQKNNYSTRLFEVENDLLDILKGIDKE